MRTNRYERRIKNYWVRTFKNKLVSTALLTAGVLSTAIDGDGTFLLFVGFIAIPLFFTKEN